MTDIKQHVLTLVVGLATSGVAGTVAGAWKASDHLSRLEEAQTNLQHKVEDLRVNGTQPSRVLAVGLSRVEAKLDANIEHLRELIKLAREEAEHNHR